ncbi:hypothetical protein SCLCIDRAFT_235092 [Scleroderma citrinum Foug A]|uniref:Uncharacterized protein n=1 Tax=Scleroderma citrinum Foug A TaxID=1036808 RepID=A0A0C3DJX5_9AGAM|nr:hypothetical protein SCLCIDRAFT_235092 [Scleroderma citrinum Foug A]
MIQSGWSLQTTDVDGKGTGIARVILAQQATGCPTALLPPFHYHLYKALSLSCPLWALLVPRVCSTHPYCHSARSLLQRLPSSDVAVDRGHTYYVKPKNGLSLDNVEPLSIRYWSRCGAYLGNEENKNVIQWTWKFVKRGVDAYSTLSPSRFNN